MILALAASSLFTCTVTGVHDGDGPIYCRERGDDGKPIKIRLQAVAARELDGTCNANQPCPAASATAAKAALARLTLRQVLRCEKTGMSYGRTTAWCWRTDGLRSIAPWFDREQRSGGRSLTGSGGFVAGKLLLGHNMFCLDHSPAAPRGRVQRPQVDAWVSTSRQRTRLHRLSGISSTWPAGRIIRRYGFFAPAAVLIRYQRASPSPG